MAHPIINQQVTFLYTRDLKKTAQFYEKTMELKMALDQGTCRIYQVSTTGYLGFCERASAPQYPTGITYTIVSSDVDGWYDFLRNKGVKFNQTPVFNPTYNIYHCTFQDPNGYLIEIQRFLDRQWPK